MKSQEIQNLLYLLSKLPGIGPRSARRLGLHLIKKRQQILQPLVQALCEVDANIKTCSYCFNWDTESPCSICTDPKRDPSQLCVVADVADIWAIERSHIFKGHYHVLGGLLSALDGITPQHLTLEPLVNRVKNAPVQEIVLALNATVEGQTTLHYVAEHFKNFSHIRLSTLAHGVPMGGELDYLDDGTLYTAFQGRRILDAA